MAAFKLDLRVIGKPYLFQYLIIAEIRLTNIADL